MEVKNKDVKCYYTVVPVEGVSGSRAKGTLN